jgi:hypothetical protein
MRRVKALAALTVLLGLLVGVPAALAATIGDPAAALPDLRAGDMSDMVLVALLAGRPRLPDYGVPVPILSGTPVPT